MLAPVLLGPGHFGGTFEADEEFPLEVEEFVQVREEEVDGILVHGTAL